MNRPPRTSMEHRGRTRRPSMQADPQAVARMLCPTSLAYPSQAQRPDGRQQLPSFNSPALPQDTGAQSGRARLAQRRSLKDPPKQHGGHHKQPDAATEEMYTGGTREMVPAGPEESNTTYKSSVDHYPWRSTSGSPNSAYPRHFKNGRLGEGNSSQVPHSSQLAGHADGTAVEARCCTAGWTDLRPPLASPSYDRRGDRGHSDHT